jgi:TatD DNase family protein
MARAALDLGFYISFAGIVTFPKATELREAARMVPLERLLTETDSPFLAPVPHRGKRNEPAYVARVVEALAAIHQVTVENLAARTTANFHSLFRP